MIFVKTYLKVADNSGGRIAECIKITRSKYQRAKIGDIIVVAVKTAALRKKVKKHDVQLGIIVRLRKKLFRRTGIQLSFSDNAVVLLDQRKIIQASRVYGPALQELRFGKHVKILSLAPSII